MSAIRLVELRDIARAAGTPERLNVLEWGSGASTDVLNAEKSRRTVGRVVTIDHSADYQKQILRGYWTEVEAITLDLDGEKDVPGTCGHANYSSIPLILLPPWDLIVIDGRRRVECAFVTSLVCQPETVVVLHDWRRWRYQHVRALFDVVTEGPEYLVMKPKAVRS